MTGDSASYIARCVKQVRLRHFGDDRIISLQFPIALPPRYSDLYPCDYWLSGYLMAMVYRNPITSLSDLKECIECHVRSIPQFILLSTAEHAILRFQMVANNGGHPIEQVS